MATKKIIVLFVTICIASHLFGQTVFSIGPKAGANFSNLRGGDAFDIKYRTGFVGGLYLNMAFGGKGIFAVAPEVLFENRGGTNRNDAIEVTQRIKVNYMTIPIAVKLRIPIVKTFYPHVYAGPVFSFLLSSNYDVQGSGSGSVKDKIDARKGDVGGIFGTGLDIEIKRFFLNLDLRYAMGALNIDKDADNPVHLKNSQFTILVGLGVRIGGE